MSKPRRAGPWAKFAKKLDAFARRLADNAQVGEDDVRITGVSLLSRTLGNFREARRLARKGAIVEARMLTRACFENLFWTGGLGAKGEAFVKQMKEDDEVNKAKFGGQLLAWSKKNVGDPETEQPLEDFLQILKDDEKGKSVISHWNEAGTAKLQDAYIIYRGLSSDAAHPSATSLSRHVKNVNGKRVMTTRPVIQQDEEEETLHFACTAMIGVCVAVRDMLPPDDEIKIELAGLVQEYLAVHKLKA